MNAVDIMDYLNSIEKKYEVQDWTINDIHIWPSLKIHIYYKVFEHFDDSFNFTTPTFSVFRKIRNVFSFSLSYIHSRFLKKQQSYDALIQDNGGSYDKIRQNWYGKFTDPLKEELEKENKYSLVLSNHKNFLYPRQSNYLHILLPLILKSKITRFTKPSQTINADGLENLQKDLEARFPDMKWEIAKMARNYAFKAQISCEYYKKLLKKYKPLNVYIVCYYNIYNAGLCKACWELNIPSHDIQHGVQNYLHPAYGKFNKIPTNGFNTLPKYFACWQQTEVDLITKWSCNTPHDAYILGNLYLEKLKTSKTDDHIDFEEFIKTFSAKNKKNYLVSLQHGMNLTQPIIEALQSCPDNYFWIRMHPSNINEMPQIINELHKHDITNYNIEEASKTPLYIILNHMDAHITLCSSTLIEAALFNIPSLILEETGALYFADYINQGIAIYEKNGVEGMKKLATYI